MTLIATVSPNAILAGYARLGPNGMVAGHARLRPGLQRQCNNANLTLITILPFNSTRMPTQLAMGT